MFAILALAEWLAFSGAGSFAMLLGILGVLALPLITGIIPVLLLVATRRKGDFAPGFTPQWLGHPVVMSLLYLFFIASILIHGVYIWESLTLRLFALVSTLAILVVTGLLWRRGLLASRMVIELRQDQQLKGVSCFTVVENGRSLPVDVKLQHRHQEQQYQSAGEPITNFPTLQACPLPITSHRCFPLETVGASAPLEGGSEGLPAQVVLQYAEATQTFAVSRATGRYCSL